MKGERLHNLIISLSQAEKNQITRFFNRATNPGSKHSRLYRTLIELERFDEKLVLEELGEQSKVAKARFESSCDYLACLILEALGEKETGSQSEVAFVRKGMEKGFWKLARRRLEQAMKEVSKREDFEELYRLCLEAECLQRASGDQVKALESFPRKWVFERLNNLETLRLGIEAFRSLRSKPLEERKQAIEDTQLQISDCKFESVREKCMSIRLQVRLSALVHNFESTIIPQQKVLELIRSNRHLPELSALEIEESGIAIRFLIITKRFSEARLETMRLRAAPTISVIDKQQKWRLLLSGTIACAFSLGDISIGTEAIAELDAHVDSIPIKYRGRLYYYASLFMAYLGNWKECRRMTQGLLSVPKKFQKPFSWQPSLLLAITAIEEHDTEQALLYLNRMRRSLKNNSKKYPSIVHKGLSQMINLPTGEKRLHLRQLKNKLERVSRDPDELLEAKYFDLGMWIDSKFKGIDMLEVARKDNFSRFKEFAANISA